MQLIEKRGKKYKVEIVFAHVACLMPPPPLNYVYAFHYKVGSNSASLVTTCYLCLVSHALDKFIQQNERFTSLGTRLHPPVKFMFHQRNLL